MRSGPDDVRIGVVDDERFFRDAICEILSGAGYTCVTAEDGVGALDLARDESIGVLILDLRLPEIDGLAVLRQVRESRPELRVLVLSSSQDQEMVLEALRLGACNYLVKPLHEAELVVAVERALEVHHLVAGSNRLGSQLGRLATLCGELGLGASSDSGEQREAYLRQAAAHGAAELLGAEKTSLLLVSDEGDELRVVAAVTPGIACQEMDPVSVGHGIAGLAFERGEALLRECGQPDDPFPFERVPGRYRSDSFVVAPVTNGTKCFGVLCATEPLRAAGFRREDLALLELFAGRLSDLLASGRDAKDAAEVAGTAATPAGLELARAPERAAWAEGAAGAPGAGAGAVGARVDAGALDGPAATDAERDSELVRQICEALVNDVEPERVIRAVLRPIERSLGAAPVSLHLIDGATGTLRCEGQLDGGFRADRAELPTSRGLTGTVLQAGHLIATTTPELDPRYDAEVDTPEDGRPGPFLCIPLSLRGQVVGLCRVFLPAGAAASARTAEALAAALSAAVRNVLLYRSLIESIEEVAAARRQARP